MTQPVPVGQQTQPPPATGSGAAVTSSKPPFETVGESAAPVRQAGQPLPFAPDFQSTPAPLDGGPVRLLGLPALPSNTEKPAIPMLPASEEGVAEEASALPFALPTTPSTLGEETQPQSLVPLDVETTQLSAQDLASIGTMTEGSGGLPEQLWDNSTWTQIVASLKSVDASARSAVLQRTLRAIALTIAPVSNVSEPNAWALMQARLDLLNKSGDLSGLHALVGRLPNDLAPDAVLKRKAETALLADDWPMACAAAAEGMRRSPNRFWTSVRLACRASEGNRGATDLLLDTTSPQDMPPRALRQVVSRVLEQTSPQSSGRSSPLAPIELATSDPATFALARLIARAPGGGAETDYLALAPVRLASLATTGGGPLGDRWPSIAALLYGGRFDGVNLLDYAISAPVNTPPDPALGLSPGQLQRALSAPNKGALVDQLLSLSAQNQFSALPHMWTAAIGSVLGDIAPTQSLWPKAGMIAAHAAYAGKPGQTVAWYEDIRLRGKTGEAESARALISVWPWALCASEAGEISFTVRLAELWLQAQGMDQNGVVLPRAKLFFAVLEGLGYDVGAALRVAVDSTLTPLPMTLPAMEAAGQNQQLGLGLLAAVNALGPGATLEPDPAKLRAVLHNLRLLGQDELARKLAIEAMFHAGIALPNAG